jgi:hypothetical protein
MRRAFEQGGVLGRIRRRSVGAGHIAQQRYSARGGEGRDDELDILFQQVGMPCPYMPPKFIERHPTFVHLGISLANVLEQLQGKVEPQAVAVAGAVFRRGDRLGVWRVAAVVDIHEANCAR